MVVGSYLMHLFLFPGLVSSNSCLEFFVWCVCVFVRECVVIARATQVYPKLMCVCVRQFVCKALAVLLMPDKEDI